MNFFSVHSRHTTNTHAYAYIFIQIHIHCIRVWPIPKPISNAEKLKATKKKEIQSWKYSMTSLVVVTIYIRYMSRSHWKCANVCGARDVCVYAHETGQQTKTSTVQNYNGILKHCTVETRNNAVEVWSGSCFSDPVPISTGKMLLRIIEYFELSNQTFVRSTADSFNVDGFDLLEFSEEIFSFSSDSCNLKWRHENHLKWLADQNSTVLDISHRSL